MNYLEVTQAQGRAFFFQPDDGPIVMLNLLRFRETADYTGHAHLTPETPITGREAYQRYKTAVAPFLEAAGSKLLYAGTGGPFIIGPVEGHWDEVLLVQHKSRSGFLAFAQDEGYMKIMGHRMAALEDSRLLPTHQIA